MALDELSSYLASTSHHTMTFIVNYSSLYHVKNKRFLVMHKLFSLFLFLFSTHVLSESKILILGDSLTEGYGVAKKESFPVLLEELLKKEGYEVTVTNAGIAGSTTASGVSRLKWHLRGHFTHLLLGLGSNDGLRGFKLEVTRKNLEETLKLALDNKLKVLILGAKMPPNYAKEYTTGFEKIFTDLSIKFKIPLMPFLLEGVAGNPKLNIEDNIHPNPQGHKIIAQNLLPYVKKIL